MLSVIIPSRNSPFAMRTVADILEKAVGDIEVIINIDERWPEELIDDPRITYIHPNTPVGMRQGINNCAKLAKGEYIMKTDDHCLFAPGFDKVLIENHLQDNWIQVPRRYSLDAENWQINKDRPYRDYHYLCFPLLGKAHDFGMHGVEWWTRQRERDNKPEFEIDDTPSFQGSCYFMKRAYWNDFLHGLSEVGYGTFAQETQEITLKTWLSGGAVKINKKTWYAHLHKGKTYGRMYKIEDFDRQRIDGCNWSAKHWMNNEEPGMKYTMEWFINEKFPGMPTWEYNWKEIWQEQIEKGFPG